MTRTTSLLAIALIAVPAAAWAQQVITPRPGSQGEIGLPPHIREQLWPARELSPVEQQLKDHAITMIDSLGVLRATNAQVSRHTGSNASTAMLRAVSRTLAGDCARAGRTAVPASEFGATLSTNNAKWGDSAIQGWRDALTALSAAMTRCEQDATTQVESSDARQLAQIAQRADAAVVSYQRAEVALLNTLKIDIDPRKGRRSR